MQIIVIGDIHMAVNSFADIPKLSSADLVVINGDLTNFGGPAEAQQVIEALQRLNPNILAQFGNLDQNNVGSWLTAQGIDIHGRALYREEGFWLVGLGGSNPTPFNTPTEFSEQELAELATEAFQQRTAAAPTLFISHCPPAATAVDRISSGQHVGSSAVRKAIETFSPALCVTGHIHEAKGEAALGTTRIYNPGMLQHGGWVDIHFHSSTGQFQAELH